MLELSPQEAAALQEAGLPVDLYAVYEVALEIFSSAILIGLAGVIFWRRPDSWMGILVSLTLLTLTASNALYPELFPNLRLPLTSLDSFFLVLFTTLFFVFPDGRFVPGWTRWIGILVVGVALIRLFLPGGDGSVSSSVLEVAITALYSGCLITGAGTQIYRYRQVSSPIQRQQTKWVMLGLILTTLALLTWTLFVDLFPVQSEPGRLVIKFGTGILVMMITSLPISIGISILRYRLWDIDIVINRTLVYGLLTGSLALIYFGSVVLMQEIVTAAGGQPTAILTVISTLVIAALFNPLRNRIQQGIDRRFYRRKYDAAQVLAAFSKIAQNEVDLESLSETLLRVVKETVQPEYVSLWLDEPERHKAG